MEINDRLKQEIEKILENKGEERWKWFDEISKLIAKISRCLPDEDVERIDFVISALRNSLPPAFADVFIFHFGRAYERMQVLKEQDRK